MNEKYKDFCIYKSYSATVKAAISNESCKFVSFYFEKYEVKCKIRSLMAKIIDNYNK